MNRIQWRSIFLLAIIVSVLGAGAIFYWQNRPAISANVVPKSPQEQDDDIREAVFRYQFEHNASGQQKATGFYFISIGQSDPSEEFMKRLSDIRPPVLKGSESTVSKEGVAHKSLNKPGVRFRISSISKITPDHVVVEGGYYEGMLSSSGNTYQVERENGIWRVTSSKMNWIS